MSRIRTIKPELLDDDRAADLPHQAWRLMVSVLVLADDWGRIRASARYLACNVFSGDRDGVAEAKERLCRDRFWIPYTVNGEEYAIIRTFRLHQRIDNASRPRLPGPEMADAPVDLHDMPSDEQIAALRASPRDDEDEKPKTAKRRGKSGFAAVRRESPRNAALPPTPTTDHRSTIRREIARAPDEVIPPGRPTDDSEPSLSLDEPDSVVEPMPLPPPAPEADRPASAKPGGLPRAVDVEGDERLRRASVGATTAPPPPDDLLDETTGPTLAIKAYNETRHPSLPDASARDTGLRAAVWATIRNDRAEARAARERGEPEPEHGMHRLAGWRELGERTHGALFLRPRRDGPMMKPTPTLLFFTKGRDGATGAQNRSALYAGTWDEIRREQARESVAERQIREGLERVEAMRVEAARTERQVERPGWMGLLEAGQRAAGGER